MSESHFWTLRIASERELPKPDGLYVGKCAFLFKRLPKLKVGTVVDLALCDPIILKGAKVLSLKKNPAPSLLAKVMREMNHRILVFFWNGGRVWIDNEHVCLLKDLGR